MPTLTMKFTLPEPPGEACEFPTPDNWHYVDAGLFGDRNRQAASVPGLPQDGG